MSASVLTRRSIEGDQATSRDADRIRAAGARALQINTGAGCHLDAEMIERALPSLRPEPGSVLVMPQFVLAAAARMTAATSFRPRLHRHVAGRRRGRRGVDRDVVANRGGAPGLCLTGATAR